MLKLTPRQRDVLGQLAAGESLTRTHGWGTGPYYYCGRRQVREITVACLIDRGLIRRGEPQRIAVATYRTEYELTPDGRAAVTR